ncbi:MAG TPA: EAL domain-containing protein [Ilumatobacteraceae bacterium]|mgnify:CR=1 FL=1|nr:EAL domain-containing protein [Ilumatobacteraceae bacterium]HRB03547.1 EAL domain-containing protein [Ilumatobacteraceae bacterium]
MGRLPQWYLATGLAACIVYFCVPSSLGGQALYTAIALSVPAVGFFALRHDRPQPHLGWLTLTLGFGLIGLAELLCLVLVDFAVRPQWVDTVNLVFLGGYLMQLTGLLMIIHARTTGRSQASWLDAIAVGVATFTIVWSTLYAKMLDDTDGSRVEWLTRLAEPVLGVALVAMALRLVLGERRGYVVFGLLGIGYVLQASGDLASNLTSTHSRGDIIDVAWAAGYVLFGVSLVHPGRLLPPRQAPIALAKRETAQALALQGTVIVGVIVAIVVRAAPLVPVSILVVWVVAAAILLVVNRLRVFSLVRLIGHASETENGRRLTALVNHSHEAIALTDADGVLRYLSSSVEALSEYAPGQWVGSSLRDLVAERMPEITDFGAVLDRLGDGEHASWQASMQPLGNSSPRIINLTVANHLNTPEVGGWVVTARDVTDEARLTAELRHQALHDTLTGLPNRALLFDRITHALERSLRSTNDQLAVALVDLDEFKSVNDSLGHDIGDVLLQAVAARLQSALRPGDTVARLGGDEFALLIEETSEAEVLMVTQRALDSLRLPIQLGDVEFTASASIGVVCHRGAADPLELLRCADIAMYEAKHEGKARVKLFREHMHHAARNQLELRISLAAALARDEFSLLYQPIVDTNRFAIRGVEALLRWAHPTRGQVPPSEFIPVAEHSGLLAPIGEWVLRKACADATHWPDDGSMYLSVNVSAAQISDRGFVATVKRALRDTGFPPTRLLLEVTETMLLDDDALALDVLAQLREIGIRIAIDDFGTGYSSLAYLRQLAVDVVKIDQSFIRDLDSNSDHQALARTLLALADGLSMVAVAEGVETDAELAVLQRLGYRFAQGYLFSYPVTSDEIVGLLLTSGHTADHGIRSAIRSPGNGKASAGTAVIAARGRSH